MCYMPTGSVSKASAALFKSEEENNELRSKLRLDFWIMTAQFALIVFLLATR